MQITFSVFFSFGILWKKRKVKKSKMWISINMEFETLKFLKKEKENPNYEENRIKEVAELKSKKMEMVKLNSVNKFFKLSKILF